MEFSADFPPTDVVVHLCMNLPDATTAHEAARAWLPLIAELDPVGVEFNVAAPQGLRRGYLADMLLSLRSPEPPGADGPAGPLRSLLSRLGAADVRVTSDEGNEEEATAELRTHAGAGPYGVYAAFAAIGYDPLNPDGPYRDYPGTDDDV